MGGWIPPFVMPFFIYGREYVSLEKFNKWVSFWGNAMSISEHKPETYGKNISFRYPIYCPFNGDTIKVTLDNYCGTESISLNKASIKYKDRFYILKFSGNDGVSIDRGDCVVSDELSIDLKAGDYIDVTIYFSDYTLLRSSVVATGPLSGGLFAVGDMTEEIDIPIEISRKTNIYYFLSNISIKTEEKNRAVVCYGDSITAQDWPDYLTLLLKENGISDVSIIRRATSGSRILREYDCITYESYGLMGTKRFNHEVPTDGAECVIIQQGINDIIHPVGEDINPFRPMTDLPTIDELIRGYTYYINEARKMGLKVYGGTLLPIEGWRTYALFREDLKNEFNEWIRNTVLLDGCIDFDLDIRDKNHISSFGEGYDSGDHLHPSKEGYKSMAKTAMDFLSKTMF